MKLNPWLRIFFASFLLMIVISPLRGYVGIPYSSIAGFILYFFLTSFCLRKFKAEMPIWQILSALLCGLLILQVPIRIIDFQSTLSTLPDLIIHFLGIVFGFLFAALRKPFNWSVAFFGFTIAAFMFFQGFDYWLHKLNFGTFTGKMEARALPAAFEASDENNNVITESDFKNKTVLLDFWNTACGVCFKKFPQVQAAFEKYKNDPSVAIFAVDKPIEEDKPGDAFRVIKEEGYSFPVVIAKDESLPEKLGAKYYPTTFVVDRGGMIVYKGDIAGAVKMVDQLKSN